MKLKKPLIISGIVIILLAVVSGYFLFGQNKKSEIITTEVTRGTLVQTVEATGVLESLDKVDLAFGTSGTVGAVNVEIGDDVEVGDLLVSLDLTKLESDSAAAAQAVVITEANLAQKNAGASGEAVAVSAANVAAAKVALEAAQTTLTNTQATTAADNALAQTNLDSAKNDWQNLQIQNTEDLSQAYDDLSQVLKNNIIIIRSALSEADEVLGIDNTMANDDFQDVLAANDSQALISANNSYSIAKAARDLAEDGAVVLSDTSSVETIESAASLVATALIDADNTLLYVRQALDGTNTNSADFSSADLSLLKTSVDTARNNIQTEEEALQAQEQLIDGLKITSSANEISAEDLVNKYEKTLASTVAASAAAVSSAESGVASAEAALTQAEASYNQVIAAPRSVDLAALEAAVVQAKANSAAATARLADARIFAPISGRVTAVNYESGEQASALATAITVQTTTNKFQAIADISESDVAKVSVNDSTEVTFDAFGDEKKFIGQVVKIDPAEKDIGGVIYYKTTVYFDADIDFSGWKPGMTTDLTILTEKIDNALLVTQRAVLEKNNGIKYVRLSQGESFTEQEVVVGQKGDGGFWQIISGLEEGEKVVVSVREL